MPLHNLRPALLNSQPRRIAKTSSCQKVSGKQRSDLWHHMRILHCGANLAGARRGWGLPVDNLRND